MTPDEWRAAVGQQLEAARKAAGIKSMREAARRAGFSEATWRQLESGKRQLAPGHVVTPNPKPDTLIAAARVTGLDPVQLVADAGGSLEDVSYAEDWVHQARNAAFHDSIAQTMFRTPEGIVGFITGFDADPALIDWVGKLPRRDRSRLAEMVTLVAARAARAASEQTAARILEELGIEAAPGDLVSVPVDPEHPEAGHRSFRVPSVVLGTDEELAMAAHEGAEDDEVGPASKRPPVGSTPVEPDPT
jgi:transcriptional regulator with XRE-family HTH domain